MANNPLETYERERRKELNKKFIDLCKQKDKKGLLLAEVEDVLENGAEVTASGCKAMYLAAKNHNFKLIDKLIDYGILEGPLARGYLAAMCDFGDFSSVEERYFDALNRAIEITGFNIDYLVPYINTAFVHGDIEKVLELCDKYPITIEQLVDCVYDRIIFEMIENDVDDGMTVINYYRDWIDEKTLGVAVSAGNTKVVEYILSRKELSPPISSVCDAIYCGYKHVLDLLELRPSSAYITNAENSKDSEMVDYLLARGLI